LYGWCADEARDALVVEETPGSSSSGSYMKLSADITGTELAFIDDLLRPDPVAIIIKVGHRVVSLVVSLLLLNK